MGIDGIENLKPESLRDGKINPQLFVQSRMKLGMTRQEILKDLLDTGLGISDCRAILKLYWEE
jgi:hypothetical protein